MDTKEKDECVTVDCKASTHEDCAGHEGGQFVYKICCVRRGDLVLVQGPFGLRP